jgi:hypothetical protein
VFKLAEAEWVALNQVINVALRPSDDAKIAASWKIPADFL